MNIKADDLGDLIDAIERCFVSPSVRDNNLEPANIVDVLDRAAWNLKSIASAITPADAVPYQTGTGFQIGTLTEAVLHVGENLGSIADAINNLAEAVGSLKS